jgi:GNAT superfamily N-acetyltransferase
LIRDTLFQSGIFDGYLFYEDGQPIGWCQVVLRDHLTKLRKQFNLQSDSKTWAITCFLVIPRLRRHGKAARFLEFILDDLRDRGVERVEAFPRKGSNLDEMDLWNGPMSMFQEAGFTTTGESATRDVMILNLKIDQRTAGQDSKGEG